MRFVPNSAATAVTIIDIVSSRFRSVKKVRLVQVSRFRCRGVCFGCGEDRLSWHRQHLDVSVAKVAWSVVETREFLVVTHC